MSNSPYGAESWVSYLKDRPLPVRNSVLRRLKRKLCDASAPLQDLKKIIKSDPVLSLHMVRKAAELHDKVDSKVTSLDHAINSLGLDNISTVSETITPLRLNPSSVAQKMYFRYISVSHHAASQAQAWLARKSTLFAEETYLASLFYGVGHWFLWQHAALHMSQIQIKIREEQIDVVLAETDILGCTVQEISRGLIESWGISELAVTSLEHETSPNKKTLAQLHQRALGDPRLSAESLREINHLVQEKFFPVKLSNWIALTTSFGWNSTKSMKIIDIINDYLKAEIAETINSLHITCAHSSRTFHVAGTMALAAEMLLLPSNETINYHISSKEEKLLCSLMPTTSPTIIEPSLPKKLNTSVPNTTTKPEFLDKFLYDQISERFSKGYDAYTQPKHILRALTQGLSKGLGFNRVALLLINHRTHSLKTALSVGFTDEHPIHNFKYDLEVPSLFKKLRDKPACIWIKPTNKEQLLPMLPETYHNWGSPNGFLLMSIFSNKAPLAIIHADYDMAGTEISEFHYELFKHLCSAATANLQKIKT
ncbi:HDOD domain-containing protein [Neptuniibacter sp. 2_MG-2023]|uniref:HDOD domain-containing protein n=1 Tax=Neptuniibacter sp. 2_MG-2023 TaxID=3062671 RepID=UPI0026E2E7D6|nr:HDOD domain-containing protein [Neptuniibacter sp. 2_MG-2023]MDO6515097.1 HDOD domain-containing protein [Neptuniibacter sp. 2_MG-2023]